MPNLTINNSYLLHATSHFPEKGVLIAGIGSARLLIDDSANSITANNPNELLAFGINNCSRQTLHFALNSVAAKGISLNDSANIANNKYLVVCKLTDERRKNLFGTISDFFFFGNHFRLKKGDIIFVPKGSSMQVSSGGSAEIIEYEGTIQEAWIEYSSNNNIPNLEYCVADQQDELTEKSTEPLQDLINFVTNHNLLPDGRTVEIHASTSLSKLEKILSFQIPFPKSEDFLELLDYIFIKYGSSFISGQEDLTEWFNYIIKFVNILLDDSIQDKYLQYQKLGELNIDYVNFVRGKAGLPPLSQEQLIQDSELKDASPFLYKIAESMKLVSRPALPEVNILPMKDPAINTVSQLGGTATACVAVEEPTLKFATQVTTVRNQSTTSQERSSP